jgi:outer membrane murein-binding lipoprotein Lpp
MIMLATFAVCITVTMRTHAARGAAEQKFTQMETEVQSIRDRNASLRRDVERLRNDKKVQEAAAPRAACVRIVTVMQTAKVASIIMLKTTHEGTEKALRRAFARVPTAPGKVSAAGEGSAKARATGRCASRRESDQLRFAAIMLGAPPSFYRVSNA